MTLRLSLFLVLMAACGGAHEAKPTTESEAPSAPVVPAEPEPVREAPVEPPSEMPVEEPAVKAPEPKAEGPRAPEKPPAEKPVEKPAEKREPKLADAPACRTDADCVKASCCHANACVHIAQAPNCDRQFCTQECRPNTLDCGGHCACQAGKCAAVFGSTTDR